VQVKSQLQDNSDGRGERYYILVPPILSELFKLSVVVDRTGD